MTGKGINSNLPVTMSDSYKPMSDKRIAELTALANKHGARIYILRSVEVDQDRDWNLAIGHGAPDTLDVYEVNHREVAFKCSTRPSSGLTKKDIVLLNYPKGYGHHRALSWGLTAMLRKTVPREVLAISENHPTLHDVIAEEKVNLVATVKYVIWARSQLVYISVMDSKRQAGLAHVDNFRDPNDWFAFSDW